MNWTLKEIISDRYRTQSDFANAIKRPETVVSKVVRGRRALPAEERQRWADALGVDADRLFGEEASHGEA